MVNKQINDEAFGIFYHDNAFEFYYPTQLHAFLLSLGSQRQSCIQDITLYYHNVKSGGVNLADLTFPMLKQLPSLRKLHVLLRHELENEIRLKRWWMGGGGYRIAKANPGLLPGIRALFSLRGITDIKLRDLDLEKRLGVAKKDMQYPNFGKETNHGCVVKLTQALEHFNVVLLDVQTGKVNKKLLEDNQWQTWDIFPTLDDD